MATLNPSAKEYTGLFIPADIITRHDISMGDKLVLGRIIALDNEEGCTASNKRIAEDLGMEPRQLQRYINRLASDGFISVVVEDGWRRTIRVSNTLPCEIPTSKMTGCQKRHTPHGNNDVPPTADMTYPPRQNCRTSIEYSIEKSKEESKESLVMRVREVFLEEFTEHFKKKKGFEYAPNYPFDTEDFYHIAENLAAKLREFEVDTRNGEAVRENVRLFIERGYSCSSEIIQGHWKPSTILKNFNSIFNVARNGKQTASNTTVGYDLLDRM